MKYATFKYGDGTKYGASSSTDSYLGEVAWIINVKWDGTNVINEASRLIDFESFRGSEYYIPVNGDGLETFGPGKATLTFLDTDRRYDEYNTTSPIYPYAVPGKAVEILVHIYATGVTESVLTGFITDIDPVTNDNKVKVIVEDELRSLQDAKYKAGILFNQSISDAIYAVLQNVGYTKPKNITYTNQPVYVFDPGEEAALDIVNELASSNLGTFYCNRRGMAIFQPVSAQNSTEHDLDQSQLLKEISFPKSWESIRNQIKVRVNRRGKRPGSVIWTMPTAHYFSSTDINEYVDYTASWDTTATPAQPTPHGDYQANIQADGNGIDVSEDYTVTLSQITSTGCAVRITRITADPGYLLFLRITGNEIVDAPHDIIDNAVTTQPRDFQMNNTYMQDSAFCRYYAQLLRVFLSVSHPNSTIMIQQRPELQYNKDLMERVHLVAAARNFNHTNNIRGIRHQWQNDTGQDVITTLYLQDMIYDATAISADPWIPGVIEIPTIPSPAIPTPIIDPITFPTIPGGFDDTPLDPTNYCLMTDSPQNGAYYATPTVNRLANDGSGSLESFLWYPCTLRAGNCINKSYLIMWGGWAYWTDAGVQTYDIYAPWWHVDAIAADKSVICSGVLSNPTLQTSPRKMVFSPSSAVEVAGFRIWIDAQSAYSAGDQIGSGSIDVSSSDGATVSGLTAGNYYSIEGDGGPINYRIPDPSWGFGYVISADVGQGWKIIGGNRYGNSYGYGYYLGTPGLGIMAVEHYIRSVYSRGYFKAASTSITTRVMDEVDWTDNGGTFAYILRRASNGQKKSLVIDNCGLKNICASGIL
jgi:hypothetical protein